MKTADAARGRWFGILCHFGIDERYLRNKHGPCPFCGGKDKFRWDDKDGNGTFFCNSCGSGDGFKLLSEWTGKPFRDIAREIDQIVGNVEARPQRPKADPKYRLRKIHSGLVSLDSVNPVRLYLRSRGLSPSRVTEYHPSLDYWEDGKRVGNYPAMIHVFQAPGGEYLTYHMTYLDSKGNKAPLTPAKKIATPVAPMTGGAVRLFRPATTMGIAEGIETALAASKMSGIPVWAATTATLLEQWQPPEGVKHVVIFGDNDQSFAGHKAAYVLAFKLQSKGFGVEVRIPEAVGTDFADELLIQKQQITK